MSAARGSANQRARKRARRAAAFAARLVCAAGLAPLAVAQIEAPRPGADVDESPRLQLAQGGISLQQAVEIATRRYRGRVVKAETTTRNGRVVHEIRILIEEENRVRTVRIDANSGDVR